jgi:hypothetical protein
LIFRKLIVAAAFLLPFFAAEKRKKNRHFFIFDEMKDFDFNNNSRLRLAYEYVQNTGKHVFLTGKAGTGKTTFLHNLRKSSWKRMVVVAPTGVAAINAGGVTIHSFFQLPFGPQLPGKLPEGGLHRVSKEKINIIRSLDLLVIDEISMVRADLLDAIDTVLRRFRDHRKSFGGVQLLMIGDLQQLAPVVKEDEWRILRDIYESVFFFSSKALGKTGYVSIELQEVYRQTDQVFLDLLNKVRENRLDETSLKLLAQRYNPGFNPPDKDGYIYLTTHNYQAREINDAKLASIKKKAFTFSACIDGDFPEHAFPADRDLVLKEGAQVMFIKNDTSPEKLFYNGKIGRLTGIDDDLLMVTCPGEKIPVAVSPLEWNNTRYSLDEETKEIRETVIGRFIQYPLKAAWAVTIHKSQGLTFDRLIIDARAAFAHGQVYVALSRCTSLEGLVLTSPLSATAVKSDHTIEKFTGLLENNHPGTGSLEVSKAEYRESLLHELFGFSSLLPLVERLQRLIEGSPDNIKSEYGTMFSEMKAGMTARLTGVGEKFLVQVDKLSGDDMQGELLQDRIGKAVDYFLEALGVIVWSPVENLYIETDNRAETKTLNVALQKLRTAVHVRMKCLEVSRENFQVSDYLKTRAKALLEVPPVHDPKKAKPGLPANAEHPALLGKITSWRNKIARESGETIYRILPRKTMVAIADKLPLTVKELMKLKGIGRKKADLYGEALISMVKEYCRENNIDPGEIETERPAEKKISSRRASLSLFLEGKSVAETARERGLAVSTIEGHLAHYVGTGELDILKLITPEKLAAVSEYFISTGDGGLNRAIEVLGPGYTYGQLKWVLKHVDFIAGQAGKQADPVPGRTI